MNAVSFVVEISVSSKSSRSSAEVLVKPCIASEIGQINPPGVCGLPIPAAYLPAKKYGLSGLRINLRVLRYVSSLGLKPDHARVRDRRTAPRAGQGVAWEQWLQAFEAVLGIALVMLLDPHDPHDGREHLDNVTRKNRAVARRLPVIVQQPDWVAQRIEFKLALPNPRTLPRQVIGVTRAARLGVEGVRVRVDQQVLGLAANQPCDQALHIPVTSQQRQGRADLR